MATLPAPLDYPAHLPLQELVADHGSPLYVYDGDRMVAQLERLKKAFGGQPTRLKYAMKALSHVAIIQLLHRHGAFVDCVSLQEVQLALHAGVAKEDILYTPNGVAWEEVQAGIDLGVQINIDNLVMLRKLGEVHGHQVPVVVRINPHIEAGGNYKISTGHADSKFGISWLQQEELLQVVSEHNIHVVGVHMHTGSDILEADVFVRSAEVLFGVAKKFSELQFIDFGSGFKVAYREGDYETNLEELGPKLGEAFAAFCQEYGRQLEMWFEPGKYLVSQAGYFVVRTNVVKPTPARIFVQVDSGLNHFLRPMMYNAYHHITNLTNPKGEEHLYTVVGYICETDTFAWDRRLPEVRRGDLLAFHNAGAYCSSMASNYNSRLRPAEVLVYHGKSQLIKERESFDDLLKGQHQLSL